uniref:Transcriptional regulator n=1 Tax=Onchocerca flexuosa TaxID=387005 RepID=A0A183H8G4_9BILA
MKLSVTVAVVKEHVNNLSIVQRNVAHHVVNV